MKLKFFTFILLGSISVSLNAASFNCAKARVSLEKTICTDTQLNAVDEKMGNLYIQLRQSLGKTAVKQLRETQRHWLKQRTKICSSEDSACLLNFYYERISALKLRQCLNLQQVIDSATSGTVIQLEETTCRYTEALRITGKENLTIEGKGDVWIIVDDINDDVIKIQNSQRVFLKNIKARHQTPLEGFNCEGSVVSMFNSQQIWLTRCELNGSGSVGVHADASSEIVVNQCYIHHNTLAAFWLDDSDSIAIHNNTITENGSTIYGLKAGNIRMTDNIIGNNKGEMGWSSPFSREIMEE
ncbi:right-handed parallel beta-helix repeat-containing protein [Candidatus Parabeggiatoa sp. HSG14]|uniref:right-handed parallel beta-helix repeat-containing protein n=1 Tax=Candidatus Parabeggiatoa sp. HSG14 TaxID=3055593 RepID=UPI0025A89F88|nr:right-handed parallel beta-helix repeat-containing protein [Thiotrichales bacterium HSG14]